MDARTATLRQDGRVLGLVCGGHFVSHIFLMALPALIPVLQAELGLTYAQLGLLVTVFYGSAGVTQMPIGMLVDRVGGPLVVALGLGLEGAAFACMGLADGYPALLGLVAVAGLGHSVFHPADFAILSATITESRVGKAFSLHTSAGHLGTAVSPALVIFLTTIWDWRTALVVIGLVGIAGMIGILSMRGSLTGEIRARSAVKAKAAQGEEPEGLSGLALFLSWPMLLMLVFFICTALTSNAVRAFSVAALNEAHGTPILVATEALSAYLFASIAGVLFGGYLADRVRRPDFSIGLAFVATILILILVAQVALPAALLVGAFLAGGFLQGMIRPQRDMLVRSRGTRKTLGQAYGYVSTGSAVGSAVSPYLFGLVLDFGEATWVFYGIAAFMAVALLAVALDRPAPG